MKAYQMLAGEPWCFTPEQIGRLTDFQIMTLYFEPAAARAERATGPPSPAPAGEPLGQRRTRGGAPPGAPGSPEHRRACVEAMVSHQGLNRQRAEAQYERQLAAWQQETP